MKKFQHTRLLFLLIFVYAAFYIIFRSQIICSIAVFLCITAYILYKKDIELNLIKIAAIALLLYVANSYSAIGSSAGGIGDVIGKVSIWVGLLLLIVSAIMYDVTNDMSHDLFKFIKRFNKKLDKLNDMHDITVLAIFFCEDSNSNRIQAAIIKAISKNYLYLQSNEANTLESINNFINSSEIIENKYFDDVCELSIYKNPLLIIEAPRNTLDITYKSNELDGFIIVNNSDSELVVKLNINSDFERYKIPYNEVFISKYTK